VDPAELPGSPSTRAERFDDFQRLAIQNPDDVIRTIGDEQPLLLGIA
jgi:hypothetical protein